MNKKFLSSTLILPGLYQGIQHRKYCIYNINTRRYRKPCTQLTHKNDKRYRNKKYCRSPKTHKLRAARRYRVFIKYCVFSKNSRKFATSSKVSYSDVGEGGVAVYCEKTQFFLNTLYCTRF